MRSVLLFAARSFGSFVFAKQVVPLFITNPEAWKGLQLVSTKNTNMSQVVSVSESCSAMLIFCVVLCHVLSPLVFRSTPGPDLVVSFV